MNKMYGITNIKTHFIRANVFGTYNYDEKKIVECSSAEEKINEFLAQHDGNIIDIQMQKIDYNFVHIMIVYTDKEVK